MAVRDYMSHSVKGCRRKNGSPFTIQTILRKHGYSTYTGENIGVNNWPDTGATYKYGCSSSGSGCDGSTTSTAPVATVQKMWMRSSGHRYNILAGYDRFGCAAWNRSDGQKYFACIFARGGPKPIDGTGPSVGGLAGSDSLRRTDKVTFSARPCRRLPALGRLATGRRHDEVRLGLRPQRDRRHAPLHGRRGRRSRPARTR